MGQQQLFLIVLGTIIIGVVTIIAINMFTTADEWAKQEAINPITQKHSLEVALADSISNVELILYSGSSKKVFLSCLGHDSSCWESQCRYEFKNIENAVRSLYPEFIISSLPYVEKFDSCFEKITIFLTRKKQVVKKAPSSILESQEEPEQHRDDWLNRFE